MRELADGGGPSENDLCTYHFRIGRKDIGGFPEARCECFAEREQVSFGVHPAVSAFRIKTAFRNEQMRLIAVGDVDVSVRVTAYRMRGYTPGRGSRIAAVNSIGNQEGVRHFSIGENDITGSIRGGDRRSFCRRSLNGGIRHRSRAFCNDGGGLGKLIRKSGELNACECGKEEEGYTMSLR